MAKVSDSFPAPPGKTIFICDYSPPRSGLLSDISPPPTGADFLLVNANPGRSVRADSAMLAAVLKQQTGREVIFALLTRDMNRLALQSHLLGAQLLGLENVVVARGDSFGASDSERVSSVGDYRPTELIEAIRSMNLGRDFRERPLAAHTNFCVGGTLDVSLDLDRQLRLSARKIEAGAEFLVTQPIFDSRARDDFEEQWLEPTGYPCPAAVYWGLQMLERGSVSFGAVPAKTLGELERGRSGVEIALELYEEMKASGISHIYLLPAIRRGGERAYAAAQEFLEEVRKREAL